MAKLFNGKIAFASALQPTGAQPLDDRTVVQSLVELLAADTFVVNGASAAYNGMIVSVLDEQKSYMLVISFAPTMPKLRSFTSTSWDLR